MIKKHYWLFLLVLWLGISACDESDVEESPEQIGTIETYAGLGPDNFDYTGDGGPSTAAKIGYGLGLAVDQNDNVFFSDGAANTIRKIDGSTQVIHTVAGRFRGFNIGDGTPSAGYDGPAADGHLNVPHGVAVSTSGNVYIADTGNSLVRVITSAGNLTTVAGNSHGTPGLDGDEKIATQANLWAPHGITVDAEGNLFISDTQNNAIRKVTKSTGKITTVAGQGPDKPGFTGDNGPAASARIDYPEGIVMTANGDVIFADRNNHVIRKISNGVITTLAGTGEAGYSGDGGPATAARLHHVVGIALDGEENIYFSDSGNQVIRVVSSSNGTITTVAGNGSEGYTGDGGPALRATFSFPTAVAIDRKKNLYIMDTNNSAIRVVKF